MDFSSQVGAQVWAQVWDQVWAQVWAQVRAQVWDQVWAQVWVQLNCKLTKLYPVTQEFKLDDLRWKSPNKDKLDALYRTLGFVHSRWR